LTPKLCGSGFLYLPKTHEFIENQNMNPPKTKHDFSQEHTNSLLLVLGWNSWSLRIHNRLAFGLEWCCFHEITKQGWLLLTLCRHIESANGCPRICFKVVLVGQ
jgi:hypothetical protein